MSWVAGLAHFICVSMSFLWWFLPLFTGFLAVTALVLPCICTATCTRSCTCSCSCCVINSRKELCASVSGGCCCWQRRSSFYVSHFTGGWFVLSCGWAGGRTTILIVLCPTRLKNTCSCKPRPLQWPPHLPIHIYIYIYFFFCPPLAFSCSGFWKIWETHEDFWRGSGVKCSTEKWSVPNIWRFSLAPNI